MNNAHRTGNDMSNATARNPSAAETYRARHNAIRAKLERLQKKLDDHGFIDTADIHWGHCGDLGRIEDAIDQLLAEVL
jgi:hypothetical protein